MVTCSVLGCKNRSNKKEDTANYNFFCFPRDKKVASEWLKVCKISSISINSRVCSTHFKESCYKPVLEEIKNFYKHPLGFRKLLPGSIPTENITHDDKQKESNDSLTSTAKTLSNVKIKPNNEISETNKTVFIKCETLEKNVSNENTVNCGNQKSIAIKRKISEKNLQSAKKPKIIADVISKNKPLDRNTLKSLVQTNVVKPIDIKSSSSTNICSVNILPVRNAHPTLYYLQVPNNNPNVNAVNISPISSTAVTSTNNSNIVKLQSIDAPAHILDHQYAVDNGINFKSNKIQLSNINNNFNEKKQSTLIVKHSSTSSTPIRILPKTLKPISIAPKIIAATNTVSKNMKVNKVLSSAKTSKPIKIAPKLTLSNTVLKNIEVNSVLPNLKVISTGQNNITSTSESCETLLIKQLKKKLQVKIKEQQDLKNELKRLQNNTESTVYKRIHEILKNIFTPKQIEKLINPSKTKINWTVEDILSAICLQNICPKAYDYLKSNNYPFPAISTIRKWSASISVNKEGILKNVLDFMKIKSMSLTFYQKLVVLNLGEIFISGTYFIIGIVRGLIYKWMQPVYYESKESLTVDTITDIVSNLYEAGYVVVSLVCKYDPSDIKLWPALNVGIKIKEECYFKHPNNNSYKIFVFPPKTEIYSLIKKHFLNNGFLVNHSRVNKKCLVEIIEVSKNLRKEFRKIPEDLLIEHNTNQKNALVAKKLFSKVTAEDIIYNGEKNFILYKDWKETSNTIQIIAEWMNIFSCKAKDGSKDNEKPYGLFLDNQNTTLSSTIKLMQIMKVEGSKKSPFQEQVILMCKSLEQLLIFLQRSFTQVNYKISYILTERLSDDLFDQFATYLKGEQQKNNNLSIPKFKGRLQKSLLGKYSADHSNNLILQMSDPCLIDFNEKSEETLKITSDMRYN